MILPITKKKIEDIEKQIVKDFSSACETAYTLPLEFSAPKKQTGSVYRVSADVVEAENKYYPTGVFAGNVLDGVGGKVLVLRSDYESLGIPFGNGDGEFLFAIKAPNSQAKNLQELVQKMYFDIDTKNSSYTLPEQVAEEKQKGNE